MAKERCYVMTRTVSRSRLHVDTRMEVCLVIMMNVVNISHLLFAMSPYNAI